jgi:hypothetical protein
LPRVVLAALGGRSVRLAALLGLKDEAVALVAVHPAEAGRAVAIVLEDATLEDVVVVLVVRAAAERWIDAYKLAKAIDEALRVGELGPAGVPPRLKKPLYATPLVHADIEHGPAPKRNEVE